MGQVMKDTSIMIIASGLAILMILEGIALIIEVKKGKK